MSAELEKLFSPEVPSALDERMRRIARESQGASGDEWLTVAQGCDLTNLSPWHVRQFAKKLIAEKSPDVYQPNPGRLPVRIRRAALRDLRGA